MTAPWLDDGDVRLFHGDALETLRGLPDGSVDCVVTSPPYWGLRDYGTGEWAGGDPDCDHKTGRNARNDGGRNDVDGFAGSRNLEGHADMGALLYRDVCGKCGATRVDKQLGLEPTPDLFVQNMVELFREVRRVLADHGTCWVNLGDSYASQGGPQVDQTKQHTGSGFHGLNRNNADLKPKDLVGIPWRVAFALQQDGWYLRSDIIWAKPNPMPESVTDRPTKAHEYVFLLTKRPRYWFDQEAVREPHAEIDRRFGGDGSHYGNGVRYHDGIEAREAGAQRGAWLGQHPAGRNVRSVWQIATQPYPEAHFATFPEELARRCILAGCPVRVCRVCGKPSERIVERTVTNKVVGGKGLNGDRNDGGVACNADREYSTLGWSDCSHDNWRPGVVLDPFIGSGTVAKVARDHQRHAIGIDLSAEYLDLAARRLQQLSLLT